MSSYWEALTNFVSHPIDSLQSILTPSTPVTPDAGGPSSSLNALFGSGGDSLSSAQVRAYGVDPSTGKLISDAYSPAAVAAGYKGNGQDFIDAVTSMVQSRYDADYANGFGSSGVATSVFGSGPLFWVLVILVLAFVFVKVVK